METYQTVLGFIALSVAYVIYQLYPSRLSGVPYNVHNANTFLGDALTVKGEARRTGELSLSMFRIAQTLKTPIAQMLSTRFRGPVVLVDDAREAEDIILRRNKEFDRSKMTAAFFQPLLPNCTIAQLTDAKLKAQKRLWADVMGVDFLRRVVAPNIHRAAMEVVELWRLRAAEAAGKPFEVQRDFDHAALDAIWVAVFGSYIGVTRKEINAFKAKAGGTSADTEKGAEQLDSAARVQAVMKHMNDTVDGNYKSFFPPLYWWLLKMKPSFHKFKRETHAEIQGLMVAACERFQRVVVNGNTDGEEFDTCAMDLVLRKDIVAAKKAGRPPPDPTQDPAMMEELLLLLLAGHDSTANTLCWWAKLIAAHPEAQTTLREALQSAFPGPEPPTAAELLEADIPYLDALVEETVRRSATNAMLGRRATVDTTILGKHIPKGTNIIMSARIFAPPTNVPEELRSSTSRASQEKSGRNWTAMQDLEAFEPRRWLEQDENGNETFNNNALPSLVFGGGLRGCFGKRLAMQELRIIISTVIMNFELLPLPEELTSMDGVEKLFRRPKMCHVKLRPL